MKRPTRIKVFHRPRDADSAFQWAEIEGGVPVHPRTIKKRVELLCCIGEEFATCSELVLACIGYLIRTKALACPVIITWIDGEESREIHYDTKGDLVEPWPEAGFNSIMDARFHYLFESK